MTWKLASWWMSYKLGMPADLVLLRFDTLPHDGEAIYFEFEGAECVPLFKSGPRKGRKNYRAAQGRHVARILVTDVDAIRHEYEHATGKCVRCFGSGSEWCGWSASGGNRERPCGRCCASGVAPKDTQTCAR